MPNKCDIALKLDSYAFPNRENATRIGKQEIFYNSDRGEAREANGFMDPGSEPGYTHPSHGNGTLTKANSLKLYIRYPIFDIR